MKWNKALLTDLAKFFGVIALVPTALFAPDVRPAYWIVVYLLFLLALFLLYWAINALFERMNWATARKERISRRKSRLTRKRRRP